MDWSVVGIRRLLAAAAFFVVASVAPCAVAGWTAEVLTGTAANARSDLTVEQAGYPDIDFRARWSTRPFEQPFYWAVRLGWHGERHGWAVELHHHKVYLDNPPPDIDAFSVTHGTNLVTLQHHWLWPRWRWLVLAGMVVAHPENTVRGRKLPETGGLFDGGYHLAGPVVGAGGQVAWPVAGWLDLVAEGRATMAWLTVDVVGGEARFHDLAFHLLVGPRVRF